MKLLLKGLGAVAQDGTGLMVVFTDRASATKFAIACDHALGHDAHTRVQAAANGKYHVQPTGVSPAEIDRIQAAVHRKTPLAQLLPLTKTLPPTTARAAATGWDDSSRFLLDQAVEDGSVSPKRLPEVLRIAQAARALYETRESDSLPMREALAYGSIRALEDAAATPSRVDSPRAISILNQLQKSFRPTLFLPVRHDRRRRLHLSR